MRRRFGRGRGGRKTGEGRNPAIDANAIFARMLETGAVRAEALEPLQEPGIPVHFAALATGTATGGGVTSRLAVGFAPVSGGDALLATLALAQRLSEEDQFAGEAIAVAPQWSIAARRRLSLLGQTAYEFRAVVASGLAGGESSVEPEPGAEPPVAPPHHVAAQLESAEQRSLFARALAAFEGLAAKHGGSVRGFGNGVELCLLARCVAALRVENADLVLVTLAPERSTAKLDPSGLATAMDRLEGALRKRLADRRVRSSDEGLRAQLAPRLVAAAGLRRALLWPLGGSDSEALDLAGVDGAGRPVVGAIRGTLTLMDLGAILDATLALRPALPLLLGEAATSPGLAPPQLLLAARDFDAAVMRVLPVLAVKRTLFDVRSQRGGESELELREGQAIAAPASPRRPSRHRSESEPEAGEGDSSAAASGPRRSSRRGGSRGRSGGRGPRSWGASDAESPAGSERGVAAGSLGSQAAQVRRGLALRSGRRPHGCTGAAGRSGAPARSRSRPKARSRPWWKRRRQRRRDRRRPTSGRGRQSRRPRAATGAARSEAGGRLRRPRSRGCRGRRRSAGAAGGGDFRGLRDGGGPGAGVRR